ncbi:hypothetical protein K435DRAFT_709039 [Dendrothele bispora CBS 962.96]|uniref:Zinc-ribbon 15 domain-containing protein n=1 Tax=Dendrothele bispora (strain CBS 962.96) TaxID=1314807 RepID=A0A4S8MXG5_DENBC|nr:hypothetical protein K435DRAFT_709039 [Dendrothele bispora CBS 962.96]
MFFCLPIFFGCQDTVKPDGNEQVARICPRCNNGSVFAAKKKTWFEFFFIPLIPFNTKHIWMCSICQWAAPLGPGLWEPAIAYAPPQGWNSPPQSFQAGYNPGYPNQQK